MNHDGFMIGMLWGGALVASVPTLLVVGVGVYVLRQHRAERRRSEVVNESGEGGTP